MNLIEVINNSLIASELGVRLEKDSESQIVYQLIQHDKFELFKYANDTDLLAKLITHLRITV